MGADFAFAVAVPFDAQPASVGNGAMIGFCVGSPDEVKRVHALACEIGGTCADAPGPRGPKLSAYVRDLDDNKLYLSD